MKFLRDNSLLIAVFATFGGCLVGQAITGFYAEEQDRLMHGLASQSFVSFLGSGAFLESVFENWESEFLEKWAYVFLTAFLVQRGSAESKDPDAPSPEDEEPSVHQDDPPLASEARWLDREVLLSLARSSAPCDFYRHIHRSSMAKHPPCG